MINIVRFFCCGLFSLVLAACAAPAQEAPPAKSAAPELPVKAVAPAAQVSPSPVPAATRVGGVEKPVKLPPLPEQNWKLKSSKLSGPGIPAAGKVISTFTNPKNGAVSTDSCYTLDQIVKRLPTVPFPVVIATSKDAALDESEIDEAFIASAKAIVVTGTHFAIPGPAAAQKKAIAFARKHGQQTVAMFNCGAQNRDWRRCHQSESGNCHLSRIK